MLDQLVCTAIIGVPLVQNVLAHFVKRLSDIKVQAEEIVHYLLINYSILVIDLLL